jgi:uncharacterized membrane protein
MALDHANHFVAQQHPPGEYWGGPFPVSPGSLAFLTRLITHLCASGFFFLMGAGMVLFADARRKQGWRGAAVAGHFLLRGTLLIALQFLIVNRAWELSPGGWELQTYVGVLFALGGAMILGIPLLRLKPRALLALSVALVLATELVTPDPDLWNQGFSVLTRLLYLPGGSLQLWVNYPILPWLGLVTFGMAFGHWLLADAQKAFRLSLLLGGAFLLAFLLVRIPDGFGNIRPRAGNGWVDILNMVKYPPSLAFLLATMGINLVLLGMLARVRNKCQRLLQPLVVYGGVPLFFYLAHLFLYAAIGNLLSPAGTSLLTMYLYWLLGLVALYPLCLAYGRLKRRQPLNSPLHFF